MMDPTRGRALRAQVRVPAQCRLRNGLAAGLVAILATACGGGGGGAADGGGSGPTGPTGTDPGAAANIYFPMGQGDRWLYEETYNGEVGDFEVDVGGAANSGAPAVTALNVTAFDGSLLDVWRFATTASVVTLYPSSSDPIEQSLGPMPVLDTSATAGSSLAQLDRTVPLGQDLDGDGINESETVKLDVQFVGRESVTTPAQVFEDALHERRTLVQTVTSTRGFGAVTFTTVMDTWYVADIGRVRWDTAQDQDGTPIGTDSVVLWAWRTGDRHGGVSPQVTDVLPGDGTQGNLGTKIAAHFGMPMDAASLQAGGFAVIDDSGVSMPGTVSVSVDGFDAVFVPATGWHDGAYRATIGPLAKDRVGDAATPRSWAFTLDEARPTIALSTPADGATDVPTRTPIVIQFSEPLDPATVGPYVVQLTDETLKSAIAVDVAFDGIATFTLTSPGGEDFYAEHGLLHGHSYSVSFGPGITDRSGNAVVAAKFGFTVDAGLFLAPQPLATASTRVTVAAIGDVTGDGLPDVVYSATHLNGSGSAIWLRAGLPGGALSPATQVADATGAGCQYVRLAIADIDSDGRKDLVASSGNCGVRIFLQSAAGVLVKTQTLQDVYTNDYGSGVALVADVDGDGHPDIVEAVSRSGVPSFLWLQQPDGSFVPQRQSLDCTEFADPLLGDFNGDGRPDLAGRCQASTLHDARIWDGAAGGSFLSGMLLPVVGNATAIASGDIDGDGRLDLVVGDYATFGGNSSMDIFLQQPDGSLVPGQRLPYRGANDLLLADVDANGRTDILASDEGFRVVLQGPDGSFGLEDHYDVPNALGPDSVQTDFGFVVGDIDGDGLPDLIVRGEVFLHRPATSAPKMMHGRALPARLLSLQRPVPATNRAETHFQRPAGAAVR